MILGRPGAVKLALEKKERVIMGGKGIGEIRSKVQEVTGVVADVPTMDSLGKRYGAFGEWGMAAGKVEIQLGGELAGCK